MRREVRPSLVRHVDTSDNREGMFSYSQFSESNAGERIREQVRYFERIGQDFEWKLYDYDPPAD